MAVFLETPAFFVFLLVLYGIAVGIGGWLVMQSERRRQWQQRMQSGLSAVNHWFGASLNGAARKVGGVHAGIGSGLGHLKHLYVRYRWQVRIAAAILIMPMILVRLFVPNGTLDSYEEMSPDADPVVTALLRGEQLVPPPSLPPEAFLTREIEAERYEIASASRDWNILDTDFRQRLLTVYQLMARHGYQMVLIEGYRSPQRQAELAERGKHVTKATAYQSYHQYGLAADSAFYRDGKVVISERDPWAMEGYRLYGQYAESVGLVWGGRWQMMDFGHVELKRPEVLRQHKY